MKLYRVNPIRVSRVDLRSFDRYCKQQEKKKRDKATANFADVLRAEMRK